MDNVVVMVLMDQSVVVKVQPVNMLMNGILNVFKIFQNKKKNMNK